MASDTMYLENLDEFVNDEDKVVTYKWLSSAIQVHVNQAKQMLFAFVQEQRKKKKHNDLHVTYFVAGFTKSSGNQKVVKCFVTPEDKLEDAKSSLDLVTSCHIFSVQKAKLKDTSALYTSDYCNFKDHVFQSNRHSAIQYGKAKARSEGEMKHAQSNAVKRETTTTEPKASSVGGSASAPNLTNGSGGRPAKTTPKGGIASMFANASSIKKDDESSKKDAVEQVVKEKPKQGSSNKPGGVLSFFANHTGKSNKVETKEVKTSNKPPHSGSEKKSPPSKKPGVKKPASRSSSDDEDNNVQKRKKRRRIRDVFEDSSSSEEEVDLMEEDPIPIAAAESPPPDRESPIPMETEKEEEKMEVSKDEDEIIPDTPQTNGRKQRIRKRKLVPKTYMDPDGFMVTEKVYESESTDASEMDEEPKKDETAKPSEQKQTSKKPSPQKKTSPGKTGSKQMSLTSFFTRK